MAVVPTGLNDLTPVRFGRFVLNRERGCLQDAAGAELFLRPKSFRLLELLVEQAEKLVSKDDLARTVWPEVIVSDDSVAHCVSDIRRALGPDGRRHIRTVPRRGYMFLTEAPAPVRPARPAASPRRRTLAAALAVALPCLAILSLAGDAPQPAETDGGVAAVEDAYLRATDLLDRRDWTRRGDNEKARDLLETVVAADPGHAEAWAALGLTYWQEVEHLTWAGGRREMRRALELVERSIALGATAPAHRLLAEMRLLAPFAELRNSLDALAAARSAVALDPGDPDSLAVLAEVLALTGRPDEAMTAIERARRSDPDHPAWYNRVAGISYLAAGMPEQAAEALAPLYDAGAVSYARAWSGWLLAASLANAGRQGEAADIVAAALRRRPGATLTTVAGSLDGFDRQQPREWVLDGLRLAGVPG